MKAARGIALALPLVLGTTLAAGEVAAGASAVPRIKVENGRTQPVFSYRDAIREHVMVETPVDSDGDGKRDRAAVDIIRPRETDRGLKVPSIMENSPYFDNLGRGNEAERKSWDANGDPVKFPLFYDNYFVPRGYAFLAVDMVGTTKSDGCPDIGGAADGAAGKAVVDWLNGRAKAFRSDGSQARAGWSTGTAGMIGKSYDGTLPNQVAATGVKGLETIVPIAAISSWYRYYRMNGMVYFGGPRDGPAGLANTIDTDPDAKCAAQRAELLAGSDDATGDYNAWWHDRNYLEPPVPDVRKVRASVFAIHTTSDLNVKPDHFGKWWDALAEQGVRRKLWLGRYHHVEPFDFRRQVWVDTLHRWFDSELYKINNGILREPRVDLQTGPDSWATERDWPARTLRLPLRPGAGADLGLAPAAQGTRQSFTDVEQPESAMVADPTAPNPNRLAYVTPPLDRAVRLSGAPVTHLRASSDRASANLTALLVDYGTDTRVDAFGSAGGIQTFADETCFGESTAGDDACYKRTETVTKTAPVEVIARGWLDARNRDSRSNGEDLRPGTFYKLAWETLPHDYTLKPGHRLGLVIAGTDGDFTDFETATGAKVTVDLAGSRVVVPVTAGQPVDFAPETRSTWRGPAKVDLPKPPDIRS